MAKQLGKKAAEGRRRAEPANKEWIDQELARCKFEDGRLTKRFAKLVRQLSGGIGQSIPWACQDWTSTKAAYRFFANERVRESAILGGHFQATERRLASGDWPILMLHDTTEFSFRRKDVAAVGMATRVTAELIPKATCKHEPDVFIPGEGEPPGFASNAGATGEPDKVS
jgi:hypothetical protein